MATAVKLIHSAATWALDLAFPARCSGCGREGDPICTACLPALDVRLDEPAGVPLGLPADIPAPLLQLDWCAPFRGVVRSALHDLKYKGEQRVAIPLAHAVARRWKRIAAGGDVVVNVPVHADRAKRRGYDQAALVAQVVAADLGLPFAPILERGRATVAQFDLDRADRAANVEGAFRLRPPPPARPPGPGRTLPPSPRLPLRGRWIVLVDDVVTTGATLAACARTLYEAGALGVSAVTVARED